MTGAVAHQRIIRDTLTAAEPHAVPTSLAGYAVETINKNDARPIIARYEWLGTMGPNTIICAGLLSPERELHGVACFGHGPGVSSIRQIIGEPALCLERGACVHYAPRNAASFLISHACKLIYRLTGTAVFFAYCDPMAGEYGAVYQAAGWAYLGQGLHGKAGQRERRYFVLPPGKDPDNPANWQTTHALRRGGKHMSWPEARAKGWQIATREAKHVYATHVGKERKAWRTALQRHPYPAPRPELKRSRNSVTDNGNGSSAERMVFRLTKPPPPPQYDLFDGLLMKNLLDTDLQTPGC